MCKPTPGGLLITQFALGLRELRAPLGANRGVRPTGFDHLRTFPGVGGQDALRASAAFSKRPCAQRVNGFMWSELNNVVSFTSSQLYSCLKI